MRKAFRKLLDEEYVPNIEKWEESYNIPREFLVKFAKNGIYNLITGQPHKRELFENNRICGVEIEKWDTFHEIIIFEELSKTGSGGLGWAVAGGTAIGLPPVIKFGS